MDTPYDFKDLGNDRMVYIRQVEVTELPEEVRDQADGRDHVYAVHSSDGACLALVKDRTMAFQLARQNDFSPVNVH